MTAPPRTKTGRGLIDLHMMQTCSGPHCALSGYAHYGNASAALRFMQHMPYLDSLWFGEGFAYTNNYQGDCAGDCAAAVRFERRSAVQGGADQPSRGLTPQGGSDTPHRVNTMMKLFH